jgi:MFS family permease
MNAISALPLALAGYRVPDTWKSEPHWTVGHRLLYRSGYDAYRILLLARLPTIALFLALCVAVYWFVAAESGSGGWAVVAALMTGLCPNLMAHGRLATVDLAAAALMFIATALFLRLLREPSNAIAVATGMVVACAVLSKTSALILGPWLAVLFLKRWRAWRSLFVMAIAALATFEVTYLLLGRTLDVTLPFRAYANTLATIAGWYAKGHEHPQFLLGEFSFRGWPHYYLVAFLLKTPIAAQLLFIAACVVATRVRSFALFVCIAFVFLFIAISATSNIDLGLRYVLPIFPFVYAAIGLALAAESKRHGKGLTIAAAVLVAWHAAANFAAYPSYIGYFNESIGSRRNADRFLIDSNLDWGQDLRRLRLWCDAHGVDFIRVDYFGGGEPAYEFAPGHAERWPGPRPRPLPRGWFAVSRHFYRLSFFADESPMDYDTYLAASKARYVTTIGDSIDVYRVP